MNVRNWTREHTIGIFFGLLTPFLLLPLVIWFMAMYNDYTYSFMWEQFMHMYNPQIKCLTLSIIGNLFWFYRFLNKENWNRAMGVILGSIAFAPYIIYIKFFT